MATTKRWNETGYASCRFDEMRMRAKWWWKCVCTLKCSVIYKLGGDRVWERDGIGSILMKHLQMNVWFCVNENGIKRNKTNEMKEKPDTKFLASNTTKRWTSAWRPTITSIQQQRQCQCTSTQSQLRYNVRFVFSLSLTLLFHGKTVPTSIKLNGVHLLARSFFTNSPFSAKLRFTPCVSVRYLKCEYCSLCHRFLVSS